jgi:PHD/YefM family antitoxin component YafN of YafNO toxin-antitoxin module
MAAIFPISDLQKRPAEVKAYAQREVVHLTENGRGAYVLMSEELFEDYVARKQEEAVWEQGLVSAVERGIRDVEEGRTHTLEETLAYINSLIDNLGDDSKDNGDKEVDAA